MDGNRQVYGGGVTPATGAHPEARRLGRARDPCPYEALLRCLINAAQQRPDRLSLKRLASEDRSFEVDDAPTQRNGHGGCPILHVQLGKQVLDMYHYRLFGDAQRGGDFLVAHATGH